MTNFWLGRLCQKPMLGWPKLGQNTVESREEGRVESRVESSVENGAERVSVQRADLSDASASVKNIYKALCKDSSLTYVGLKSKLGLSTQTIAVAMATLIKRGLLRRVGPKKGGHWETVEPPPTTEGPG